MSSTTGLHISISAETLTKVAGIQVSNSMLTSLIVSTLLIILALIVRSQLKKTDKPTGLQNFFEWIVEALYDLVQSVTNNKKRSLEFFPVIATFFLFIVLNNLFGLLPGVGTIGFIENGEEKIHATLKPTEIELNSPQAKAAEHELETEVKVDGIVVEEVKKHLSEEEMGEVTEESHEASEEKHSVFVPYLRAGTADLNMTIALGIISVVLAQYFGLRHLGLSYLKKYLNFSSPIMAFVGLLEVVSEFAKIISFAFRLFGNIFAGEVLLAVISHLTKVVIPMPFYGLEIFVGFIQALVFAMLSLVFFNMATQSHEEH